MDWMKIITDTGTIFLGSILLISLTIIAVDLYLLSKYNRVGDAQFDVFYIEDGTFIINSIWKITFSLDDIERVEVGYAPYYRHGRPYIGFLRIVYPNGNRSCRYYFDISVVTRKVFNFKYHQDDIFRAIHRVQSDLEKEGIPYTLLGFEYLGWKELIAGSMKNQFLYKRDKYITNIILFVWFTGLLCSFTYLGIEFWKENSFIKGTFFILAAFLLLALMGNSAWNIFQNSRVPVAVHALPTTEKEILRTVGAISTYDDSLMMEMSKCIAEPGDYIEKQIANGIDGEYAYPPLYTAEDGLTREKQIARVGMTLLHQTSYTMFLLKNIKRDTFLSLLRELVLFKRYELSVESYQLKDEDSLLTWCKTLNKLWKPQSVTIELIRINNYSYWGYLKYFKAPQMDSREKYDRVFFEYFDD
ncbi:MAG: hypothetical protein ACTTG9_05060 [Dialister pneumosintes]